MGPRAVATSMLAVSGVAVAHLITRSVDVVRRVVGLLVGGGRALGDLVCAPVSVVPVVVRVQRAVAVSVGLRAPPVLSSR